MNTTSTPTVTELDTQAATKPVARRKPAKAAVSAAAGGLTAGVGHSLALGNAGNAGGVDSQGMQQKGGLLSASYVQPVNPLPPPKLVNPLAPPKYVFKDGYDLQGAFNAVRHLVATDEPSVEDAAYGQYCAYLDRVGELENTLTALAARRYANAEVMAVAPYAVGAADRMGGLTSFDEDTGAGDVIELHTHDAVRLFLGFDAGVRVDGSKQYSIPGAVRVGSALRTVSSVAVKYGNPFAEMALIQLEGLFADLALEVEKFQNKHQALIDLRAKRGVKLNVRRSSAPQQVPLGFKSPYGFACADLVAQFDYFARVVATTGAAGLVTKEEARVDLLAVKTKFRAVFNDIMRMGQLLGKENLAQVSRGDWVLYHLTRANNKVQAAKPLVLDGGVARVGGGELAQRARDAAVRMDRMDSVAKCEQLFGMLPSALLLGEVQPKFVSSKVRVTAEERVLIQQLVNQRSGIAVV